MPGDGYIGIMDVWNGKESVRQELYEKTNQPDNFYFMEGVA